MAEFKRIGDILRPALEQLASSDEVRAYGDWWAAVGEQVAAVTSPRRLVRGTLTVECESSVWAQELTFLSGELLAKMAAADPSTPVKRLRFITRGGRS